jgi:hypothetical protein
MLRAWGTRGGGTPSYMLHTSVLRTYLLEGYLPCSKIIRYGIFQNKGEFLYYNTPYK